VVVPSIWWENSPLVIQEAFLYGRPVICSDVGGMAEKVRHGIDGLHFAVGDPASLADTIRAATTTPGLWDSMTAQIQGAHPMTEHLVTISETYRKLLSDKEVPLHAA
jgi:glycosyltransferase involved in cell wall biosynthesis